MMAYFTKKRMIDHIHYLFTRQLKTPEPTHKVCVLRKGELKIVTSTMIAPADLVIVDCTLVSNHRLSRSEIKQGVEKNWDALRAAGITIEGETGELRESFR